MLPWILLTAAQAQSTLQVPQQYQTVQAAAIAADTGDRIEVDGSDNFTRDLANDALITKDVTIVGVNGRPKLPRLNIVLADVTVENAVIEGVGRELVDIGLDVGLFAIGGAVTLRDVDLYSSDLGSAGLVAQNSTVDLFDVYAADFWIAPPVYAVGGAVNITRALFEGNIEGSINVTDADLTVTDSDFYGNYGYVGSDIYTVSSTRHSLTVANSRFDLSSGAYGGAISANNVDLDVSDSDFTETYGWYGGGAILAYGTPDAPIAFDVRDSTFYRTYSDEGGAILVSLVEDGKITGCTFSDNAAVGGGAVSFVGGSLTIEDSDFSQNWAIDSGGAIKTVAAFDETDPVEPPVLSELTLRLSDIHGLIDVSDAVYGGCVWAGNGVQLNLEGGSFEGCGADLDGGAIDFGGSELSAIDVQFKDNSALRGGGIFQEGGRLFFDGAVFRENTALFGAALSTSQVDVDLNWSWFTENHASGNGVVELLDSQGLTLHGNRFCANSTVSDGIITSFTGDVGDPYLIANNVWLENSSDLGAALRATPSDWLLNLGPELRIVNNDSWPARRSSPTTSSRAIPSACSWRAARTPAWSEATTCGSTTAPSARARTGPCRPRAR